ncbi:hypothetical protein BS329_09755 [Amycolatopsis coloradensis]|uniref:PE domain-containing protein n=1 Tax=Amycolatopsis coloradensis TaxID=76021 RepID=A0A1R0KVR6_9PSEU|nr:hypothetical protein [Amycolatopsis coloradensis]OLZ53107.1 hypothetical protein BS329_09755 [Amycolatopsis coloradensis]
MSGGFQVFPEQIRGAGSALAGTGKSLAGEVAAFQSQTAALGDAFGDDDLGSALGTIYQIASEAAFESFHDNAEGIGDVGQTLQIMAGSYADYESTARDSLHQLGGLV